ncbi:hypothetical protein OED52_13600 [Rhodococcus sp. Z13]|uniref:Uncharacterized protein n=1 Tax=Rhodococcus sacchari TaxID=2962047 RepID=A0ACD4DCE1_9NOCA|nr:hypothetical protein [Rhodococcus sp. Z13]UYP17706.1 hypothetical protein OED52_13600 [Rhodococcus sp. Z13]
MTRSGTILISSGGTWTKVTGMTVRAGFPDTVIVNDALVMNEAGAGTVRWQQSFLASSDLKARVVKNGTEVIGSPTTSTATGEVFNVPVLAGDTLELQISNTGYLGLYASGWLEYVQTTQNHPASSDPEIGWYTGASAGLGRGIDADAVDIGFDVEALVGKQAPIEASRPVVWSTSADMYVGQKYDIGAEVDWEIPISADLDVIRKVEAPSQLWEDIALTFHTVDGRNLGQLVCQQLSEVRWARERNEVSGLTATVSPQADPELLEDLRPWVHWVSAWDGLHCVWQGPIQQIRIGRQTATITAKDPSTFMWRTRSPISKTWSMTDPTSIAAGLIQAMNELHRIPGEPIVLPRVTEAFTYTATSDSRMLHQMMDDLAKLGLAWTVVSGRFILGEFGTDPVAQLDECDFLVEIERLRDGTSTFNDVRVQGQNWAQTAVAPLAGLRLQTLVSMDDLFGVSNIQKATRLYANEVSAIRDSLVVPSGASLHPQAPISVDDLVPGKCVRVTASGVVELMMIDQVQVVASSSSYDTQLTLVAVQNTEDVSELVQEGRVG